MIKTGIQVDAKLWQMFRIAAAVENRPGHAVIADCIRQYLEKNHPDLWQKVNYDR